MGVPPETIVWRKVFDGLGDISGIFCWLHIGLTHRQPVLIDRARDEVGSRPGGSAVHSQDESVPTARKKALIGDTVIRKFDKADGFRRAVESRCYRPITDGNV